MSIQRIAHELLGKTIPKKVEVLSTEFKVVIKGPPGTPYEGGRFIIDIKCLKDYPRSPPLLRFRTKIYHPNIDHDGNIGLKHLSKEEWTTKHTLGTALQFVEQLLKVPNIDDALEQDIAEVLKSDKPEYLKKARAWTLQYAKGKEQENDGIDVQHDVEDAKKDKTDDNKNEEHVEEHLNKVEKTIEKPSFSSKKKAPSTVSTQDNQDAIAPKYTISVLNNKGESSSGVLNKAIVDNKDGTGSSSSHQVDNKKNEPSTKQDVFEISSSQESLGQPENKPNPMSNKKKENNVFKRLARQVPLSKKRPVDENSSDDDDFQKPLPKPINRFAQLQHKKKSKRESQKK